MRVNPIQQPIVLDVVLDAGDETVIALTLLMTPAGRTVLRLMALGLALGMLVACSSGLESRKIARDLTERGKDAALEAADLTIKNRPEAARIRLRQHVKDIDEVIEKVKKDELINDRDKTGMLQELQVYRGHFVSISRSDAEKMNDNEAMEWQIRQTPGIR